ncbi:MAG: DUF2853 family protein [Planctomycetota bacterium]
MSQFEDVIAKCKSQMEEKGIEIDDALLESIARSLGPSIYNADGLTVATAQKSEVDTVREFAKNKMGAADGDDLEGAIAKATETLGQSNPNKLRPVFYYIMAKALGKESAFS